MRLPKTVAGRRSHTAAAREPGASLLHSWGWGCTYTPSACLLFPQAPCRAAWTALTKALLEAARLQNSSAGTK